MAGKAAPRDKPEGTQASGLSEALGRDGVRPRHRALGHADMLALVHAALDLDGAALGVLGLVEGVDHEAGAAHLLLGRGEGGVGGLDLIGVDQGLAVEAEVAGLATLGAAAPAGGGGGSGPAE